MINKKIQGIIDACNVLNPGQRLNVEAFGSRHDLTLSIEKDRAYNALTGNANLVDIVTLRNGKAADDAVGIYVTDANNMMDAIFGYHFVTLAEKLMIQELKQGDDKWNTEN